MRKRETRRSARLLLLIGLTAVSSAVLFLLCYHADNKYTAKGPQAREGVLALSERDMKETPMIYLITGWEIFRGKLLAPGEFDDVMPDEIVFIGQYGGLEGPSERGPHGSATYRLRIALPPTEKSYTLELPEIYSAYRLYINGELMAALGEPDREGYRPSIQNGQVTARASGGLEIVVAASDYSHFYSGMVYPPAFGDPSAVGHVLNLRLGLRFAAVALSLGVGLLYLGIWLLLPKNRDRAMPLLYAALCCCFALYICYPAVKTLAATGPKWYALESLAYPAMLLAVTQIQSRISGAPGWIVRGMTALGVFVCCWAAAVPFVLGDSLNLMLAHSRLLTAYTWLTALYLLAASFLSAARNAVMLAGAVVFASSLVMDRLLPLFEPIRFGWFAEISGACFVVLIGAVMAGEVAGQFRLRLLLEGRVESVSRMMEAQKNTYAVVLEKEEELRAARHDLRHHMTVMRELAGAGDLEKLTAYAVSFDGRVGAGAQASYCKHAVTDMLLRMYAGFAERQGMAFMAEAALPETLPVGDIDLCVILSNLLENALEAARGMPDGERWITVRIRYKLHCLGIITENAFNGEVRTRDGRFLSGKQKGREGVGLASVRAACARHGGSAVFTAREPAIFHCEILIPGDVS